MFDTLTSRGYGDAEAAEMLRTILTEETAEERAAREARETQRENQKLAAASPQLPGMGIKVRRKKSEG